MTPRQLFTLLAAILLLTALLAGLFVGSTGAPFDAIDSGASWLTSLTVAALCLGVIALFHQLVWSLLRAPLRWLLSDTGAAAIRGLGFVLVLWLAATLFVALTWAWLGQGQTWREAPCRWLCSAPTADP